VPSLKSKILPPNLKNTKLHKRCIADHAVLAVFLNFQISGMNPMLKTEPDLKTPDI